MQNLCPILIRASFIGRTYHDFLLKFQSPPINNCTINLDDDPLLVQFTRILNSTFNHTSYALYDPREANADLPHLQVFHNDYVNLCLRSAALNTNRNELTCHEFYMITMLSSTTTSIWPLLIIFAYLLVLILAIVCSYSTRLWKNISRKIFWKKLATSTRLQIQRRKINEKKELLQTIEHLAKEYQSSRFIDRHHHHHHQGKEHINRGYF